MMNNIDSIVGVVFLLIIAFLVILLIIVLAIKVNSFSQKLDYIKMEIQRSRGEERRYWIREKRRLWLSLLPFCRY